MQNPGGFITPPDTPYNNIDWAADPLEQPTTSVYSATNQRFYWGSTFGNFYYDDIVTGSSAEMYASNDCYGTLSVATGQTSAPDPQFYALCIYYDSGSWTQSNLFACNANGGSDGCSIIDQGIHLGSLATDENGNLYVAWGSSPDNIIRYPHGQRSSIITFIAPSNIPKRIEEP